MQRAKQQVMGLKFGQLSTRPRNGTDKHLNLLNKSVLLNSHMTRIFGSAPELALESGFVRSIVDARLTGVWLFQSGNHFPQRRQQCVGFLHLY